MDYFFCKMNGKRLTHNPPNKVIASLSLHNTVERKWEKHNMFSMNVIFLYQVQKDMLTLKIQDETQSMIERKGIHGREQQIGK